ncbi:MAG: phosphatase PAP2 family protein [Gemmatimonas sp.]
MMPPLLARLDARDRALFARLALDARRTHPLRGLWTAITHCGSTHGTIGLCILSTLVPSVTPFIAGRALLLLGLSHVVVQIVKRFAVRDRPTVRMSLQAMIRVPDRFSFPSGHACAAMTVAAVYAWYFPMWAVPLLALAVLAGLSRVVLGVHYPGDVVVGQAIAVVTAFGMLAVW